MKYYALFKHHWYLKIVRGRISDIMRLSDVYQASLGYDTFEECRDYVIKFLEDEVECVSHDLRYVKTMTAKDLSEWDTY